MAVDYVSIPYSRNRFAIEISLPHLTCSPKVKHYLVFGQCGVAAVCLAATARFEKHTQFNPEHMLKVYMELIETRTRRYEK